MQPTVTRRIICLSNVYDQNYLNLRGEKIDRSLDSRRPILYRAFELATGLELVVLSAPRRAAERRSGRWLPPVETKFGTHRQSLCANWDFPKLRIPLSWFFYALHVRRHTRSGDLVLINNYEFLYIVAVYLSRLFRRLSFVLDYADGKHLIDRSWARVLSGLAEAGGRPLIRAATLCHPSLGGRLPSSVPVELVPGFVARAGALQTPSTNAGVRFLYSGTLDRTRGLDLVLDTLRHLPEKGWRLDISGWGPLEEQVMQVAHGSQWAGKVRFHQSLPPAAYDQLLKACHVGLNPQRASDPISAATSPSKVFTYLSAGLSVISSQASEMQQMCGRACLFYAEETPQALAAAMKQAIHNFPAFQQQLDTAEVCHRYSLEGTAVRLERLLKTANLI
jgi:glycosyltransferase involved in cell wall biosynthesis